MNDLQRTAGWYAARQGKLTASMIYLVLTNRKVPMTEEELAEWKAANPKSRATQKEVPFSQTALTWLHGKVQEWAMSKDSFIDYCLRTDGGSRALDWGIECEPLARTAYEQTMQYHVDDAPFIPYEPIQKYAGGSPDGILKEQNAIVEFKCPYTLANHFTHLNYLTGADLLTDNEQYYAQCQMNMMVAGSYLGKPCEWCDFVSYDPRVKKSLQLKVLRLFPDEDYQKNLAARIELAAAYIKEHYNSLGNINTIITQ